MNNSEISKKTILEALGKEPLEVLEMAYLYANDMYKYGADIRENWDTAVKQSSELEKAYMRGVKEGMDEQNLELGITKSGKSLISGNFSDILMHLCVILEEVCKNGELNAHDTFMALTSVVIGGERLKYIAKHDEVNSASHIMIEEVWKGIDLVLSYIDNCMKENV